MFVEVIARDGHGTALRNARLIRETRGKSTSLECPWLEAAAHEGYAVVATAFGPARRGERTVRRACPAKWLS